ncbi:MAG: SMI1/KNR4 family protein [Inconstantimicrobium porci]|uniref:SMI1/KNR4 family protein n=1 Tax=Inconstantimicrobium porci TaxID=2652291 RepID=UPI002A90DDAA|nr:SMI1/KNR4 family protein [Inconstantimicrobium porci]MDY5911929.1 SMI1/KNR4 family protein [Inconstantimicrobium porci]
MNNDNKKFIYTCFETLIKKNPEILRIKEGQDVPEDMMSDNGTWKLVESQVTDEQIRALEDEFKIKIPQVFKNYLSSYYYLFDELNGTIDNFYGEFDKKVIMYIPKQPSDAPLKGYADLFRGLSELIDFGYIPIGDFYGWGPICFDTLNNNKIVWLDHDEYYDCKSREELDELAEVLFNNFEECIECFFCGKVHDCDL